MKRKKAGESDSAKDTCKNDNNLPHSKENVLLELPTRDTTSLFASETTITCAQRGCIPCAYKVGNFDVALDKEFCSQVPNQRPEQCPRVSVTKVPNGTLGFWKGMSVLTVGDGDFSFSLAIARILSNEKCRPSLVATSYEEEQTLERVYPGIEDTIAELKSLGAKVCFKVDGTALQKTCPALKSKKFQRICWNFPCTAIAKGQDGQNLEMEQNKDLVRKFVRNSITFLSPLDGEVVICHKTKPPFNQWKLEQVALENALNAQPALEYAGRVVLDKFLLPPYTPRKALHRKSFPCHDACFYIFHQPRKEGVVVDQKFPATIGSAGVASDVVAVTAETVQSIRVSMFQQPNSRTSHQKAKKKQKL